jgi:DNA polymerase-1
MSNAALIYETDKRSSALGLELSLNGFLYDVQAAEAMSNSLHAAESDARARVEKAVGRPLKRTDTGGISGKDLHQALFKELRAPVMYRSNLTKKASLGIDAMRAYAACGRDDLQQFAVAELERRRANKVRRTYIDKVLRKLTPDRRVHATYKNYGTLTGRFSCSDPNLQNLPSVRNDPTIVWAKDTEGSSYIVSGGIRSLYIARPGYTLCSFDFGQLEFRVAAYASGDENMIRACETGDIHSANAELVWGDGWLTADKKLRKELRALAKNFGFAIAYGAEAKTLYANIIANGQKVQLQAVQAALRKLKGAFTTYYRWQDQRLLACIRNGWTDTPLLGRQRWTGHTPSGPEVMNHPIQGGGAEVVTRKLCKLDDEIARLHLPAYPVAMVHDSFTAEVQDSAIDDYQELVARICAEPVIFSSSGRALEAVFPIDYSIGKKWS